MVWHLTSSHAWASPLDVASSYADQEMALLFSSLENADTHYSFLLLDPQQHFTGSTWEELPPIPKEAENDLPYFVGYIGYEGRFYLTRYERLLRFCHQERRIDEFRMLSSFSPAEKEELKLGIAVTQNELSVRAVSLQSNFTRARYQQCITDTIERIHSGDFYQANITRKFWGKLLRSLADDHLESSDPNNIGDHEIPYFLLFAKLCELSPSPYSAYIRHGRTAVLSSSPECFLSIHETGTITTRPIKGSAARDGDTARDIEIQRELSNSSKDLAENLMITDLMRHDLAQVSEVDSVRVTEQSALRSYRTIHHLVSTVASKKLPSTTSYEVVRACFPPGSMTGAPKIAAMRWCAEQEKLPRGIYSGALGWFGGNNTCDLSVIIRTLIFEGNRFEFQVGGGIVADSTPGDEWQETLSKAKAILQLLAIRAEEID